MIEHQPQAQATLKPLGKLAGFEDDSPIRLSTSITLRERKPTCSRDSQRISDQIQLIHSAEKEAEKINNRIHLLSLGKQKALKEISITNKKAQLRIASHERYTMSSQQKYQRHIEKEQELQQRQFRIAQSKEIQEEANKQIRESMILRLRSEVKPLRELKKHYREVIQQKQKSIIEEKLATIQSVKDAEKYAEDKKEYLKEQKIQKTKQNYNDRLHFQMAKREFKELEIDELKKSEKEMAEQFRSAKELRDKALEDFQDILLSCKGSPMQSISLVADRSSLSFYQSSSPNARQATITTTDGTQELSVQNSFVTDWTSKTDQIQNMRAKIKQQGRPLSQFFVRQSLFPPPSTANQYNNNRPFINPQRLLEISANNIKPHNPSASTHF